MADIRDTLVVVSLPPDFKSGGFDCGEEDLNDYLCDGDAQRDEKLGITRTYLVMSEDQLVGYFSVLADAFALDPGERPEGMVYPQAPALKLARMGVANEFHGNDIGVWMLDYVVGMARAAAPILGLRYVTLDALPREKLVAWYGRYGFVRNDGETANRLTIRTVRNPRIRANAPLRTVSMRYDIQLVDGP